MTGEATRSRRIPWALLAVLALGLVASVVLIAGTHGEGYDINNARAFGQAFRADPLHAYGGFTEGNPRYPYPPAWLPVILASEKVADWTPLDFGESLRLLGVVGTLLLATLVWYGLGVIGAGSRERLGAAALVALGPAFLAVGAVHGQIDVVAFLPVVAALVLWQRLGPDHRHRALWCGLLIGLGAGIKTVPIFLALALLPQVRNRREAVELLGAVAAVPALLMLPFFLSDPHSVLQTFRYNGGPGVGGLSLFVQPGLAESWIVTRQFDFSSATDLLQDLAPLLTLGSLVVLAVLLLRARVKPQPWLAASLVVLTLWVFGVNYFLQYAVWGLPFFLMARWWRAVLVVQLVYLVPLYFRYHEDLFGTGRPTAAWVHWVYVPVMMGLWLAAAVVLFRRTRRLAV